MSDAVLLREAWVFLGVDRWAKAEQIRAAWKQKLKEVHPDVGGTKEAAQHATNMRDVLLVWIEAGRPDLETEPDPISTAYARAQTRTQNFRWQHAPQSQSGHPWNARWRVMVFCWIVSLLVALSTHQPQSGMGRYGLPI